MQWTVVVVCIYFVHLYFAFVFSSRKHQENVFIWGIYYEYLPHAFGIGTVLMHPPRSIAFGNSEFGYLERLQYTVRDTTSSDYRTVCIYGGTVVATSTVSVRVRYGNEYGTVPTQLSPDLYCSYRVLVQGIWSDKDHTDYTGIRGKTVSYSSKTFVPFGN